MHLYEMARTGKYIEKESKLAVAQNQRWTSLEASLVNNPPANAGDSGLIPESERHPREGNGNPFQYSCWRISGTEEPGRLQSIGSKESSDTT